MFNEAQDVFVEVNAPRLHRVCVSFNMLNGRWEMNDETQTGELVWGRMGLKG